MIFKMKSKFKTCVALCFLVADLSIALNLDGCHQPLGMQSGAILDKDILASSSYNHVLLPQYSRLDQDAGGGAWCPDVQNKQYEKEYLQVNFNSIKALTAVATQGRYNGIEFISQYQILYIRPGFASWKTFTQLNGNQILQGNDNSTTIVKNLFEPVLLASAIRIVPGEEQAATICLRVELYGCNYTEGLLSYSIPNTSTDLPDKIYDGFRNETHLSNGLGSLTDGQLGLQDSPLVNGSQFHWLGWNKHDYPEGVHLFFTFDRLREFYFLKITSNNLYFNYSQVFSSVEVNFSSDGIVYANPVTVIPTAYQNYNKVRTDTIPLHHRHGQFVTVRLNFATEWILLSEVQFESRTELTPGFLNENSKNQAQVTTASRENTDTFSSTTLGLVSEDDDDAYVKMFIQTHLPWIIPVAVVFVVLFCVISICYYIKFQSRNSNIYEKSKAKKTYTRTPAQTKDVRQVQGQRQAQKPLMIDRLSGIYESNETYAVRSNQICANSGRNTNEGNPYSEIPYNFVYQ